MEQLTLILDNIRSAHNVGGILRNAVAFGVQEIYCTGITPYPLLTSDHRLPHVSRRATEQIRKTALGAEKLCHIHHFEAITTAIHTARNKGAAIYALELQPQARDLAGFQPELPAALILGNEVDGIHSDLLKTVDEVIQIAHTEAKESLNVTTASGIALYHFSTQLRG
ncbi:MAG: TrmH family RNA methyltransferase [Candidatus Saccharimonadales bacterium]